MSEPTKAEYKAINKAVHEYNEGRYDPDDDNHSWEFLVDRVAIIRSYCSDCPSWTGDVAFVIFGEVCFKNILIKENGKWEVAETIYEGEYTQVREA